MTKVNFNANCIEIYNKFRHIIDALDAQHFGLFVDMLANMPKSPAVQSVIAQSNAVNPRYDPGFFDRFSAKWTESVSALFRAPPRSRHPLQISLAESAAHCSARDTLLPCAECDELPPLVTHVHHKYDYSKWPRRWRDDYYDDCRCDCACECGALKRQAEGNNAFSALTECECCDCCKCSYECACENLVCVCGAPCRMSCRCCPCDGGCTCPRRPAKYYCDDADQCDSDDAD